MYRSGCDCWLSMCYDKIVYRSCITLQSEIQPYNAAGGALTAGTGATVAAGVAIVGSAIANGVGTAVNAFAAENRDNIVSYVRDAASSQTRQCLKKGFEVMSNPSSRVEESVKNKAIPTSKMNAPGAPSRTNNVGGSLLVEGGEEEHATLMEWLLETAGEKLYIQNKFVNPSYLNSIQPNVELNKFLSRPVIVNKYVYSAASTTSTEISPWDLVLANNLISEKLNGYKYFRANLNIKAVIHSSPFLFGGLLLTYRPYSTNKTILDSDLIIRTQRKNIYVYPQTSSGGSMQVPFFYPDKFFPLDGDATELGTINILPMTPLRTSNGTAPGDVTVTIYAWFTEVYTTGATLQSETCQTSPVNIARLNLLNKSLDYDKMGGAEVDETSISHIISKDALFLSTPLATSTAVGTVIANFVGNPMYFKSTAIAADTFPIAPNPYIPFAQARVTMSPLAYAAKLFDTWSGDILIRCKILKTKYHRGRLNIIYDPASTTVPAVVSDANRTGYSNKIIDIGETDEFVFNIPFITHKAVLKTGYNAMFEGTTAIERFNAGAGNLMTGFTDSLTTGLGLLDDYTSGIVTISLDSELKAPGVSDDIQLLFYVSAAPNFRLYKPVPIAGYPLLNNQDAVISTAYASFSFNNPTVSLQASIEKYKVHEFGEVDNHDLADVVNNEYVSSFRTLMQQYSLYRWIPINITTGATSARFTTLNFNGYPSTPGFYTDKIGAGGATVLNTGYITTTTAERDANAYVVTPFYTDITAVGQPYVATLHRTKHTYLDYVSQMFCGHRGDIKWRVTPISDYPSKIRSWINRSTKTTLKLVNTSMSVALSSASTWATGSDLDTEGAPVWQNCNHSGSMSYVSPYMSNRLFYTVDARYRDGRRSDNSIERGVVVSSISGVSSAGNALAYIAEVGACENYEPLYFLSTPVMYFQTSINN